MKYIRFGRMAALLIAVILLLAACGNDLPAESSQDSNPEPVGDTRKHEDYFSDNTDLVSENSNELPQQDPNADYIQNYLIDEFGDNLDKGYTDNPYIWVRLKADSNSWAAIDETGKIYAVIPMESAYMEAECGSAFICFDEHILYSYDGTNVTEQYLEDGETLLRITSCSDDFIIWKYQTDKKYQEDTVYTFRACSTDGKCLAEMTSSDDTIGQTLAYVCKYSYSYDPNSATGSTPVFKKLSEDLYLVWTYLFDLKTGHVYNIEDYETDWRFVSAANDVLFVQTPLYDPDTKVFYANQTYESILSAYYPGEYEPLYSWSTEEGYIQKITEYGILVLTSNDPRPELRDIYTGERIYRCQAEANNLSYSPAYSPKYDVFVEQVGAFVGVFKQDGTPCFEPIEGNILGNWLEYTDYILIEYKGHQAEGSGLYIVDVDGNMRKLDVTLTGDLYYGVEYVLHVDGQIMVNDDGRYKLFDSDWNQIY